MWRVREKCGPASCWIHSCNSATAAACTSRAAARPFRPTGHPSQRNSRCSFCAVAAASRAASRCASACRACFQPDGTASAALAERRFAAASRAAPATARNACVQPDGAACAAVAERRFAAIDAAAGSSVWLRNCSCKRAVCGFRACLQSIRRKPIAGTARVRAVVGFSAKADPRGRIRGSAAGEQSRRIYEDPGVDDPGHLPRSPHCPAGSAG